MLGELIINSLVLILGYAYPAFECFKTIEKHNAGNAELRFWCQYWVIIAVLTVFERIGDIFVSWYISKFVLVLVFNPLEACLSSVDRVPMYGEMKLALIIYLWYPKIKSQVCTIGIWKSHMLNWYPAVPDCTGTGFIYNAMLRPFVARHETDIERSLKEMRAKAWDVAVYYWHNSSELGQTRFFEIVRFLVSKPSRPRSEVLQNHQNSREAQPAAVPPSVPQPDRVEDRWVPTAPPMPNVSQSQPAYPEDLHIPGSPGRPGLNPGQGQGQGQREPVWLRFKRSRGL